MAYNFDSVRCGCCQREYDVDQDANGGHVAECPECGALDIKVETRAQVLPHVNLDRFVDGEAVKFFWAEWTQFPGGRSHGWMNAAREVVQFG